MKPVMYSVSENEACDVFCVRKFYVLWLYRCYDSSLSQNYFLSDNFIKLHKHLSYPVSDYFLKHFIFSCVSFKIDLCKKQLNKQLAKHQQC